mgnify:CR=1 FL=1
MSIIYSAEITGVGLINGSSYNNEKNSKDKYITGKTSLQMAQKSDEMMNERF